MQHSQLSSNEESMDYLCCDGVPIVCQSIYESYEEEGPLPEFLLRHKDPLMQLVSLQRASGCWLLDADLAAVLKKTSEEVEKAKPASVGHY
ncbi:hypothetical protein ILYODFUR_032156 [Ilyodon furcidens]|uniref:Uncharacterized protein n=1 Tax=Ilyodon furcidens TaxID=33524 RepID=A0ABV0UX12_9TELE